MSALTVVDVSIGLKRLIRLTGGELALAGSIDQSISRQIGKINFTIDIVDGFINTEASLLITEDSAATAQVQTTLDMNSTAIENLITNIQTWPETADALKDKVFVFGNTATLPAIPTGLTTSAVSSEGIEFKWNTATGAHHYTLKGGFTSGGPYFRIKSRINANSFFLSSVEQNVTDVLGDLSEKRFWVLSSFNKGGESIANSNQIGTNHQFNASPTGLVGSAGNAQVELSWNLSPGALTYDVENSSAVSGTYVVISNNQTATSFVHSSLTNGVVQFYRVRASDGQVDSDPSPIINATPESSAVLPGLVTGITKVSGDTVVALSWGAAKDATSYDVRRRTGVMPFVSVGTTTNLFFNDSGLTNGTTYDYRIFSVNSVGTSVSGVSISSTPSVATSVATTVFIMSIVGIEPGKPNFDVLSPHLSNEKIGPNLVLRFLYGNNIGGLGDKSKFPTESGVKNGLASQLPSSYSGWLVYDLERFTNAAEINHLNNIVIWTKEQLPKVKLGFYGQVPKLSHGSVATGFGLNNINYASDHNANITYMKFVIDTVDGFFFGAYPDGNDMSVTWKGRVDARIDEIRRLDSATNPKLIMPTIRANFINGALSRVAPPPIGTLLSFDPLTKAQFRFMLTHLDTVNMRNKGVQGALWWNNPARTWAEVRLWGWWPATQEHFGFMSNV